MTDENEKLTRRRFLGVAGAIGTCGLSPLALAATGPHGPRVPIRPFGRSGVRISSLSLGISFDSESRMLVLKSAMDRGITAWETAPTYAGGRSESGIGRFFRKFPLSREDVFLVTKSLARKPADLTDSLEGSLRRTATTYSDLFLLHGTRSPDELTPEIRDWARGEKEKGRIRLFGFSTHANVVEMLRTAPGSGWIDGILMRYNYHLLDDHGTQQAIKACVKAGIGLIAMKIRGMGPAPPVNVSTHEPDLDRKRFKAIWEDRNIASTCMSMRSVGDIEHYTRIVSQEPALSSRELESLAAHALSSRPGHCSGCATICESAVSEQAPIADVMRFLMYFNGYGEPDRARRCFATIPSDVRERLCSVDYGAAEARCPNGLPIARLIREAARILA